MEKVKIILVYCLPLSTTFYFQILRLRAAIFPPVDAEANQQPETSNVMDDSKDNETAESESDSDVGDLQLKKKPKKEKVGFRERKVFFQ